jgi:mannose-6-phosphate isomerase-like protein (cupin superfamily)
MEISVGVKTGGELTNFTLGDSARSVQFVETVQVKEGVTCDVYRFIDSDAEDLAIVTVQKGFKMPLQQVMEGKQTVEGLVAGRGVLTVWSGSGEAKSHVFETGETGFVSVAIGERMQWSANGDSDLSFYEVCTPPYKDGRFKNTEEDNN